jgi:hypothetical protein
MGALLALHRRPPNPGDGQNRPLSDPKQVTKRNAAQRNIIAEAALSFPWSGTELVLILINRRHAMSVKVQILDGIPQVCVQSLL